MSLSSLKIHRIIQIVKAIQRIPRDLTPRGVTFYSVHDVWLFTAEEDSKTCVECNSFDGDLFEGNRLRALFPWHGIFTQDQILPMVHPHCRCMLTRVIDRSETEHMET